jgi:hypothetical protein
MKEKLYSKQLTRVLESNIAILTRKRGVTLLKLNFAYEKDDVRIKKEDLISNNVEQLRKDIKTQVQEQWDFFFFDPFKFTEFVYINIKSLDDNVNEMLNLQNKSNEGGCVVKMHEGEQKNVTGACAETPLTVKIKITLDILLGVRLLFGNVQLCVMVLSLALSRNLNLIILYIKECVMNINETGSYNIVVTDDVYKNSEYIIEKPWGDTKWRQHLLLFFKPDEDSVLGPDFSAYYDATEIIGYIFEQDWWGESGVEDEKLTLRISNTSGFKSKNLPIANLFSRGFSTIDSGKENYNADILINYIRYRQYLQGVIIDLREPSLIDIFKSLGRNWGGSSNSNDNNKTIDIRIPYTDIIFSVSRVVYAYELKEYLNNELFELRNYISFSSTDQITHAEIDFLVREYGEYVIRTLIMDPSLYLWVIRDKKN